ncbi:MAG: glycoside hydrolase family 2 TIM barrel-domain containing protein, partial [Clostridia bacterium]
FTAFDGDISEFLTTGKNTIVVVVDSTERDDIAPFGNVVDYLCYGGIYREVELISVPLEHIELSHIKATEPFVKDKPFEVAINFNNPNNAKLETKVIGRYRGIKVSESSSETSTSRAIVKGVIENAILWDVDNPVLYDFQIQLIFEGKIIDETTERFGFRKCEFKIDGFYLNGKKLKLRGLNRHQSYPYVGYAMPKSMQVEDARFLKEDLRVNIVRTSHYPQSQHFLNACDELGLLVFTEATGWQHIGGDDFKDNFKQTIREMIAQNFNHPSIIMWGVRVNESNDCDELYIETNKIAHELDDTRQTGGVRCIAGSRLFEDVYTYNDFNHDGKRAALAKPLKITKATVPYLVTENNGHMFPTTRFYNEERCQEHAIRHARVLDAMYKNDNISGCINWCMADYNTHKDFGSGDRICYHGVADMFRIPKLASAVFSSQGEKSAVLEVGSEMAFGDHDQNMMCGFYIFTNCDYVEMYKNDKLIDTLTAKGQALDGLPHPPIYVPDIIGTQIEQDGKYVGKDAARIRKALRWIASNGLTHMPLKVLIPIGYTLMKHKVKFSCAVDEFSKYLTNWGDKENLYTFKGYKNNNCVITKVKGAAKQRKLVATPTTTTLVHGDTYDVALVKILLKSENDNVLKYAFDGLRVTTDGAIELVGGENIALIGGAVGVYVKSIGKGGGTLYIESDVENLEIKFNVL